MAVLTVSSPVTIVVAISANQVAITVITSGDPGGDLFNSP